MSLTKKNHFVPCFYSSLWCGEDRRLCEFSRPYKRVNPQRKFPAATGYSEDLYTEAALSVETRTYLEDIFLKKVDQRASDALKYILEGRMNELSVELKCAWARFIMSMIQRSPEKIAELRRRWQSEYLRADEATEKHYQELRRETDPPTLIEYLKNASPETLGRGQVRLLQSVMDLPNVGEKIINMRWSVLTIPDVMFKFLTSDRPIVMSNGIEKLEGHVGLPIGPRKIFLAANDRSTIENLRAMPINDLVMLTNRIVTSQAEKYVYGETDMAVNFVEKHLRR